MLAFKTLKSTNYGLGDLYSWYSIPWKSENTHLYEQIYILLFIGIYSDLINIY